MAIRLTIPFITIERNTMPNTLLSNDAQVRDNGMGLLATTITGHADKWFFLASASVARARRAESCLLTPQCGDTVLVCQGVNVGVTSVPYILAVLSRPHSSSGVLSLPGGADICAEDGKLSVHASEIELSGTDAVQVSAPRVAVRAHDADMQFVHLNSAIKELRGVLGSVTTIAQTVNSTVGRLLQKAGNSFRWTENLDETRAGRMRLHVTGRYHLKSGHASMVADGQVKIDGEKIDLG
jgi:hypothetical protein